ncbi:hypothetical protein E2320_015745, partial [Naja naja]
YAKKVPLFDIKNDVQEAVATNPKPLEFPDTRVGPGSFSLQNDPVKRPGNYNGLGKHAEVQDASISLQKQTRSKLVIVETGQKSAEKEERPSLNKTQAKESKEIPEASQNHVNTWVETRSFNKDGKNNSPASNKKEETNKGMAPGNEEKEKAKAKRVTPLPPRKQTEGKAAKQQQLLGKNAALPSTANQTHWRKQSNKTNLIKEHSAKALVSDATTPKRLKAADFKSEPRWEFDDIYLLDNSVPPSTCPDSLRNKAAKSDWLHDIFLPNITVFMDRSHFSDSEWKRMEHFAPPFGFMELNFSLVKEVISMLPSKPYHHILFARNSSQTSKCVTCAVVGNGGILNNSRMGKEIDSHDYVFRVSGAVIKGYEKDVGTRTSFYGFTAYSLMTSIMILGNRGFKKIPAGKVLKSKTLEKPYWRLYRPTTGAFLLLTALHLCDQVSAYGYITEGYQKYSDHYYDKERKRLIFYTNHDFNLERNVWKQFHDANIMKLYQRT